MSNNKKKKVAKSIENASDAKVPKHIGDPDSYLSNPPVWKFSRCDREHDRWSLYSCGDTCNRRCNGIIRKLMGFEGQTWAEIMSASGGKRTGTNSHFIPVAHLVKEAQKRAEELKIDDYEFFSLRLDAKKRLWGVIDGGVFQIIWYDPNHEICPSHKK